MLVSELKKYDTQTDEQISRKQMKLVLQEDSKVIRTPVQQQTAQQLNAVLNAYKSSNQSSWSSYNQSMQSLASMSQYATPAAKEEYIPGAHIDIDTEAALQYAKICILGKRAPFIFAPVQVSNGLCLPTLDIDKSGVMQLCYEQEYVVFQSSQNSFWMIFDVPLQIEDAIRMAGVLGVKQPGSDNRYQTCATKQKKYVLRATPKGGFIPKLRVQSGALSELTEAWVNDFVEYWKHPIHEEIASMQVFDTLT
jgi:hypothetical protein